MLVQALDGKYYKDVMLNGDGYCVVYVGDGLPYVCVRKLKHARKAAVKALEDCGANGKIREGEKSDLLLFGGEIAAGWKFDFLPTSAIPVPLTYAAKVTEPKWDDHVFGFWTHFKLADLADWLMERSQLPLLNRALLGEWIEDRPLLKRRLLKEVPQLRMKKADLEKLWDSTESACVMWTQGVRSEELSLD